MYFRVHDWPVLPSGQSYFGNQSDDNKPNGLGVITLEDDHHFYIGEFVNGKRHGRGFLLTHEEWDSIESVWVRGSYEEVMATAEFDSCGRVIHVDNVGHYEKQEVHHEVWKKSQDGYWQDDAFVKEVSLAPLHKSPWKDCYTSHYLDTPYIDTFMRSGEYKNDIDSALPDGACSLNLKAYVTIYDDDHLMFVDSYGCVFVLGIDETFEYDLYYPGCSKDKRVEAHFTYSLYRHPE